MQKYVSYSLIAVVIATIIAVLYHALYIPVMFEQELIIILLMLLLCYLIQNLEKS